MRSWLARLRRFIKCHSDETTEMFSYTKLHNFQRLWSSVKSPSNSGLVRKGYKQTNKQRPKMLTLRILWPFAKGLPWSTIHWPWELESKIGTEKWWDLSIIPTYSKYFHDISPCTHFKLYHYIYIYHIYLYINYVHVISKKFGRSPSHPALCPVTCGVVASWDHPEELLQGRQQPGRFQRGLQAIQTLQYILYTRIICIHI